MSNTENILEILSEKGSRVFLVDSSSTVQNAVAEMNKHRVGCVLIMEGQRMVGILTERDVLTRVVVKADADVRDAPVKSVMTANPVIIGPDASVDDVMRTMTERRVRHLPVIEDGSVLGMISIGDMMRHLLRVRELEAESLRSYISGEYPG